MEIARRSALLLLLSQIHQRSPNRSRLDSWEPLRLVCSTTACSATVHDWVYPNEIAQPPDAWGRRVLRVIDKSGESFIACEKPYSRRRASQRFGPGSRTAA